MSKFTTPLKLQATDRYIHGRTVFRLLAGFGYEIGVEGSGVIVDAPIDFETDFGSVPWIVRWGVNHVGRGAKAYVIHDLLYSKFSGFTRWMADAILYEALGVCGVGLLQRVVIYYGLRLGGRWAYKASQKG